SLQPDQRGPLSGLDRRGAGHPSPVRRSLRSGGHDPSRRAGADARRFHHAGVCHMRGAPMDLLDHSCAAGFTVQPSDTAPAHATGAEDAFPAVFATSRMVALMEIAAARLLRPLLKDGELSVGVSIDVNHGAATPVGCRVRAVATYQGQEGKL